MKRILHLVSIAFAFVAFCFLVVTWYTATAGERETAFNRPQPQIWTAEDEAQFMLYEFADTAPAEQKEKP